MRNKKSMDDDFSGMRRAAIVPSVDSYNFDGGRNVEGLSSSQPQPFDIYFYKSDDAAGLGNRNVLHDQQGRPGTPITRYTNLDIITANGDTLTDQTVVLLETLGEGTFADCYKAEYNGRIVAVKILKAFLHSSKQREAFDRELHALRRTADSKLTLDLIGYRPQPHYWLITSYMNEGTLHSRIKAAEGRPLPLREVLDIGVQISAAMQYLHAHLLMHRDLTPFNLLFHEGSLRLADFGVTVDLANLGGGPDATVPASPPLFSSSVAHHSSSPFSFAVPSFLSPPAALPEQYDSGYLMSSQIVPTTHPLGFRGFGSAGAFGAGDSDSDEMALDEEVSTTEDDEEFDGECVEMGDTGEANYDLAYDMSPNGHPYYRAPGSSCFLSLSSSSSRLVAHVTLWWSCCAEVNEGRAYSLAAEVFNFGSVLYECMTGTVLTAQAPLAVVATGLRRSAERERRGNGFPDELWRLQTACWDRDPRKRPSFDAILQRLSALRARLP
jgi:serine/threonine protein kinase